GAADQVIGLARIGQSIGRRLLIYGGAQIAYSIQDGRLIGVSVSAVDPALPASEFIGANNLNLRELQLLRDKLDIGGGFIVRLSPSLELNGGYEYTAWGRNTAAVHAASISLALRVEIF
ncbi:MAG: hypothetical protein AAF449_12465, partial [Myxococcota bacterium]